MSDSPENSAQPDHAPAEAPCVPEEAPNSPTDSGPESAAAAPPGPKRPGLEEEKAKEEAREREKRSAGGLLASAGLDQAPREETLILPPQSQRLSAEALAANLSSDGNGSALSGGSSGDRAAAGEGGPPGQAAAVVLPLPDSPFAPAPPARADVLSGLAAYASSLSLPATSGIRIARALEAPPRPTPEPLLQAEGLTKAFGKRVVVREVDLQVGAGEIVGLLGRNGAGKTTAFRMIMGMLQPDSGRVRFDHHEITRLPMYVRANRGLGYLAQEPSVFQKLSVEDNLLAVLELQVPERVARYARLEELIRLLGLETVRKSRAATLSGGERRRLEIARAMTLRPKIVLFDEPFAGIDPIAVNEIQNILRDLRATGVGVLLTDHNVRETLTITDRTYIMDEGRIWIHGSPREIVNHPEARSRYLGYDFRLDF